MAGIKIEHLGKAYEMEKGVLPVLSDLSLEAPAGEITVLLGKSGCGKTTLLRLVSGLEQADAGSIQIDGNAPSVVFQEPRLMPWLNVYQNVVFGLEKREREEKRAEVEELLRIVGLDGFAGSYPSQLSGGMQSRCALARALAVRPSFLLMDEPFAALDYFTRESMQKEVLRIQKSLHTGILFVTHSIEEALLLGDRISVMGEGRIRETIVLQGEKEQRDQNDPEMVRYKNNILSLLAG